MKAILTGHTVKGICFIRPTSSTSKNGHKCSADTGRPEKASYRQILSSLLLDAEVRPKFKSWINSKIQVFSTFQKFVLCHFPFRKDLCQHPFSLTERNPKRISAFMEKCQKVKVALRIRFAVSIMEAAPPKEQEWCHQVPSLRTTLYLGIKLPWALNHCECFRSIYFLHLLAILCCRVSEEPKRVCLLCLDAQKYFHRNES